MERLLGEIGSQADQTQSQSQSGQDKTKVIKGLGDTETRGTSVNHRDPGGLSGEASI